MKGRECSQWLGLRRGIRRGSVQTLNSGEVLVVPGGDGEVDEVQLVTVMSNAWSASSISSRYGVVVRLEELGRT
jgi:hypothetical protein